MSTAALNLPYTPQLDSGAIRSFVFAVMVHCALFGFLYLGVRWQSETPPVIEAELWTAVPSTPAPAPKIEAPRVEAKPEPKPEIVEPLKPASKPDIAEKIEKKPLPKKEESKAPDPIKKALLREEFQQKLRQEAIEQQAKSEANSVAARSQSAWAAQIAQKVRSRVRLPENLTGNPEAVFDVTLLPTMEVLTVKLVKPSGNPAYDEAAERAIHAASPLPPPPAGVTPERTLRFPFRPKS